MMLCITCTDEQGLSKWWTDAGLGNRRQRLWRSDRRRCSGLRVNQRGARGGAHLQRRQAVLTLQVAELAVAHAVLARAGAASILGGAGERITKERKAQLYRSLRVNKQLGKSAHRYGPPSPLRCPCAKQARTGHLARPARRLRQAAHVL